MIGNTTIFKARKLNSNPCPLFLKLEGQSPGGSIKDRIGISLIQAAEREGKIRPGGTVIEATEGNTGLGLALVAAQKGYKILVVVPDKMSQERIFHITALGAEAMKTRSDVTKGRPDYYQDMAEHLSRKIENSFWVNQFANQASPAAHEMTTSSEI